MDKTEALKQLREIYPHPCTNVGYGMGYSLEYDKYKDLIKKRKFSDEELDWLINSIRKDKRNNLC